MGTLPRIGLLLALLCTDAWAGNEEGVAAYERGDCELAYREFSDAATHGDSDALLNLTALVGEDKREDLICKAAEANNPTAKLEVELGRGWGEPVCGTKAVKPSSQLPSLVLWSAEQGAPLGMWFYARMLATGLSDPPDLASAYAWYSLAERRGNEKYTTELVGLADKLSPEELLRAKQLTEQLDKRTPRQRLVRESAAGKKCLAQMPRR